MTADSTTGIAEFTENDGGSRRRRAVSSSGVLRGLRVLRGDVVAAFAATGIPR